MKKNQELRFICAWFTPFQCGQSNVQEQGRVSMLSSPRAGACLKHVCTLWNRESEGKKRKIQNYCLKLPTFYVILSFVLENHFKV